MKVRFKIAAVLLWILGSAVQVPAKPLLVDDMAPGAPKPERSVSGGTFQASEKGRQWKAVAGKDHIRYVVAGGEAGRPEGTFEVAFRVGPARAASSEAVCILEGPGGKALATLYFVPEFNITGIDGKEESVLILDGYGSHADVLYGKYISLGRIVPPGETIHLAVAWSVSNPGASGFYANGKRLDVYSMGRKPRNVDYSGALSSTAARTASFRVGSDPFDAHPMSEAAVTRVAVHDVPLTPGEMSGAAAVVRSVADDTFKKPGISGKLVAGDVVNVTLLAAPGGKASFDMGNAKGIPLAEVPATPGGPGIPEVVPGTYAGSYAIRPGDDYENGQIVGRFTSQDNVVAEPVTAENRWTIETKPAVAFSIDRKDLPADSAARSRVKLVAKDANGNALKGRHVKLTLATTDEYTGTVGAGDFGKQVGASVETKWRGETDSWGEVEFEYTAGFAAKSVILTAKDLDSGGVAVDYITAYKEASIDIMLTPPRNLAAARRGMQYIIKVEASRTELTADGRSRSVIRATVTDPNGKPAAGEPVAFALSSPNGTLRTISGTTDSSGVATAEYVAGKKIGIVVVTATAAQRGISGNVSIILLSDAPAKIYLKARPDSLPADGSSRADLSVKVTDINDNPNKDTRVDFKLSKGTGKLDYNDRITDRFGETQNRYTAGTTPGIATILATVRSKVPSAAELLRARNVLFAPWSDLSEEIRVEKWLKKKGETALKGEPVVQYTLRRRSEVLTLAAPFDLTMGDILVEYWDSAEVGQTLAHVVPKVK